jgi:hypothetical protein
VSRVVGMLSASALVLWAMTGPASAATPFTTGTGSDPSVAVGSDGTGHVVWATPNPTSVGYCRVSAGAEACNRAELLAFGGANPQTTGRPVVFTPAPNKVVIVAGCWNCGAGGTTDRVFRWTSSNNGTSFDPPVEVGTGLTTEGAGTWLDAEGIFVGVSASRVKGASASTPGEGVQYATGGIFSYGPEVTRVPGTNKLVAVTNDLDVVKYGVYTGAPLSVTSINDVGNWLIDQTLVSPEGDNSESAVNSGPNGVSMTYRYFVPNDSRVGLRRFDSATNAFGPPTYVEGADTIDNNSLDYPDSFQDPSGRLHVVWRSLYDGGRLRYRVSDTSGATFTAAANLAKQEGFFEPDIAAGADGKGFVAWTSGSSGNVRVVPIDPQPEPGVSPPPGGGSGPTIRPVFTFRGRGNSLTARIVGSRIKIRMKGAITLPPGANPSLACKGKLRLKIKKGRRTMLNRTARLKFRNGKCRFAKTVFLKRSKVGKTRRLRLKLRFGGNTVLKAGSVTKTLIIRK